MTKKLIWRLKEQPSTEALMKLVADGLLTKEEAREMLFSSETEEDRDKKSLESEIKFLRELVDKLSNRQSDRIVEVFKTVKVPYFDTINYPWYNKYQVWSNAKSDPASFTLNCQNTLGEASKLLNAAFSEISTF